MEAVLKLCWNRGSQNGDYEECDPVYSGRSKPTFRRIVLPLYSGSKSNSSKQRARKQSELGVENLVQIQACKGVEREPSGVKHKLIFVLKYGRISIAERWA
jgi:hypothetical protein